MSANLIHNMKYGSKPIFNKSCAKAAKNINKLILQNKTRQFSNHILARTTYSWHSTTSFFKNYTTGSSFDGK